MCKLSLALSPEFCNDNALYFCLNTVAAWESNENPSTPRRVGMGTSLMWAIPLYNHSQNADRAFYVVFMDIVRLVYLH